MFECCLYPNLSKTCMDSVFQSSIKRATIPIPSAERCFSTAVISILAIPCLRRSGATASLFIQPFRPSYVPKIEPPNLPFASATKK